MKNYALVVHSEADEASLRRAELIGCLDSHTVVKFEREMEQLLKEGVEKVILNLEGLTYISSAGISALMGLTHRLRQRTGELVLLRPSDKVLRVFRTLGFTNIFKIVEDEADVTADFKSK